MREKAGWILRRGVKALAAVARNLSLTASSASSNPVKASRQTTRTGLMNQGQALENNFEPWDGGFQAYPRRSARFQLIVYRIASFAAGSLFPGQGAELPPTAEVMPPYFTETRQCGRAMTNCAPIFSPLVAVGLV